MLALAVVAGACSGGDGDASPAATADPATASTAPATTNPPTSSQGETPVDTGPVSTDPTTTSTSAPRRSIAGTQPAPEFPTGLDWLNTDRPLSLERLRGKVVMLDFWTYGCINCIHIIPDLERLEHEFADELVVIGVHSAKFSNEGNTENIRQVVLRYDLEHPVVNDRDFIVWRIWGATAWPTVVLIDPAGNVVGGHSGEGIYGLFQPAVASLVEEFDERGELDRTPLDVKLEKEGLPESVLSFPGKVEVDAAGETLFVADTNHHRVVVADARSGEVLDVIGSGARGFAEGGFAAAAFDQPQGLALTPDGSTLYVADLGNHAIRAIDLTDRSVSTLAGTGQMANRYPPLAGVAPDVSLNSPWDLVLDRDRLFIAMAGSHQIWDIDLLSGVVAPLVGSGAEGVTDTRVADAELAQPSGLALGWGRSAVLCRLRILHHSVRRAGSWRQHWPPFRERRRALRFW